VAQLRQLLMRVIETFLQIDPAFEVAVAQILGLGLGGDFSMSALMRISFS